MSGLHQIARVKGSRAEHCGIDCGPTVARHDCSAKSAGEGVAKYPFALVDGALDVLGREQQVAVERSLRAATEQSEVLPLGIRRCQRRRDPLLGSRQRVENWKRVDDV